LQRGIELKATCAPHYFAWCGSAVRRNTVRDRDRIGCAGGAEAVAGFAKPAFGTIGATEMTMRVQPESS